MQTLTNHKRAAFHHKEGKHPAACGQLWTCYMSETNMFISEGFAFAVLLQKHYKEWQMLLKHLYEIIRTCTDNELKSKSVCILSCIIKSLGGNSF